MFFSSILIAYTVHFQSCSLYWKFWIGVTFFTIFKFNFMSHVFHFSNYTSSILKTSNICTDSTIKTLQISFSPGKPYSSKFYPHPFPPPQIHRWKRQNVQKRTFVHSKIECVPVMPMLTTHKKLSRYNVCYR